MSGKSNRDALLDQRLRRSEKRSYLPEDKLKALAGASQIEKELKEKKEAILIPIENLEFAPDDINFFPEISSEKMNEMMLSIIRWGLFSPIIVWKIEENRYMVLSGKNRVNCFNNIIEKYKNIDMEKALKDADKETHEIFKDFDLENFKKVPSYVYEKNEISLEEAKEIVIETNSVQRDSLFKVRNRLNLERVKYLKKKRDIEKKQIEDIAKELGFTKRNFFYYQKIEESLIKPLKDKFVENELKFSLAREIARLDISEQENLNELRGLNKIKNIKDFIDYADRKERGINQETLNEYLNKDLSDAIKVMGYRIPKKMQDDFKKHIEEFLNKKDLN